MGFLATTAFADLQGLNNFTVGSVSDKELNATAVDGTFSHAIYAGN